MTTDQICATRQPNLSSPSVTVSRSPSVLPIRRRPPGRSGRLGRPHAAAPRLASWISAAASRVKTSLFSPAACRRRSMSSRVWSGVVWLQPKPVANATAVFFQRIQPGHSRKTPLTFVVSSSSIRHPAWTVITNLIGTTHRVEIVWPDDRETETTTVSADTPQEAICEVMRSRAADRHEMVNPEEITWASLRGTTGILILPEAVVGSEGAPRCLMAYSRDPTEPDGPEFSMRLVVAVSTERGLRIAT